MRKKSKIVLSLFLAVVLVCCSVVTPSAEDATAVSSTITVSGQTCIEVYEICGSANGMFKVIANNQTKQLLLENPPVCTEVLLQVSPLTTGGAIDNTVCYQQVGATLHISSTTTQASFNFNNFSKLTNTESGWIIAPQNTVLPSGNYSLSIFFETGTDSTGNTSYGYFTSLTLVTDGTKCGFLSSAFSALNHTIYDNYAHTENSDNSDYLFNFYRNYNASSANLSVAEREAVQKTVDILTEEFKTQNVTDTYTKVLAVHNLLAMVFHYDYYSINVPGPDGQDSAYRTIYEVLASNRTVCEGYANVFAAMLSLMNIPNRIVHGYGSGSVNLAESEQSNHAWNEVYVNGHWLMFDVTWDSYNTYNYNPSTGKESWTYTDSTTGQEVTTETFDPSSLQNRLIGTVYADCGMEYFSQSHRINEYIVPKTSYRQWVYPKNSTTPVLSENTEECYFVVNESTVFANGSSLTEINSGLPQTVTKITPKGQETVPVQWLTQYVKKYNASEKGAQSFEISGAVYDKDGSHDYKQIDIVVTVLAEAPNAPVITSVEKDSITVKKVEDAEYSCDGGLTWQESNIFTGLSPNTAYNIKVRTINVIASTASSATTKTTLKDYIKGDADEDGVVTLKDAYVIGLYLAGQNPQKFYKPAACYTSTGEPTLKDAAAIARKVLN